MPHGPAFAAEFGEVGGVCVDGENHVASVVADAGVGVRCNVIEEFVACFRDCLGSVGLLRRDCAEGGEQGGVSHPSVVEESTDNLLNALFGLAGGGEICLLPPSEPSHHSEWLLLYKGRLDVPQDAASRLYEDNDACTAIANAQKPTSRTRHMDIRYHVLCEWVERDLIVLEQVDTTINEADHFTKLLSWVLFHRHIDYIMGHVPPEYPPAHARSTGQFGKPSIGMVPDSYTTKDTFTTATPEDDCHIPVTARVAHIYSPDYSALVNNYWTKIVATASCLPYNPTLHYTTSNCGEVLVYIGLTT